MQKRLPSLSLKRRRNLSSTMLPISHQSHLTLKFKQLQLMLWVTLSMAKTRLRPLKMTGFWHSITRAAMQPSLQLQLNLRMTQFLPQASIRMNLYGLTNHWVQFPTFVPSQSHAKKLNQSMPCLNALILMKIIRLSARLLRLTTQTAWLQELTLQHTRCASLRH